MKRKLLVLPTFVIVFFSLVLGIRAQDFIKGFSLKLTGGYGTISSGDINTVLQDHENLFNDLASLPNSTREGELKRLNTGFEYEAELIITLTEHIELGIGAGYIQREESSKVIVEVNLGDPHFRTTFSHSPDLNATPIRLSVYILLSDCFKSEFVFKWRNWILFQQTQLY